MSYKAKWPIYSVGFSYKGSRIRMALGDFSSLLYMIYDVLLYVYI